VFVLSDLDIGMNDWIVPKLKWDDAYRPDRGKVMSAEDLEKAKSFYRYLDVDGDGIPYRSLPGVHPKGAYFTRGSGHNKFAGYTEDEHEYTEVLDRIDRKIRARPKAVPQPIVRKATGAKMGLITVGGCHAACIEALDLLAKDGVPIDFMRVRGFPFGDDVKAFVESHDVTFVVEQNRDAQLRSLLVLETGVDFAKLESVRYYGGFPMSAHHVITGVRARLERAGVSGAGVMTYISKPKVHHPALQKNAVGLTRRDYEGSITTLCAGCGHDSVTAAIVQAFWDMSILPHQVAKMSGIGCSSKTPAYFLRDAHGFNGVHGRMPALATGANAANADLIFIGISGTATRCRSASGRCRTPSAGT
jgi:TPP-dependent indolepyruvate ferredoxin oxidoreductase alpha subunit